MFNEKQKEAIQELLLKRSNYTLKERLAYELELFGDAVDDCLDDEEASSPYFYIHLEKITKTIKLIEEQEKNLFN